MWYVMQVRVGSEEAIVVQCKNVIEKNILNECFVPYYEFMKKYHGEWHRERKVLFPGYVFLISEHIEELYLELKKVIGLTKMIGTGEEIVPLSVKEVEFLETFGEKNQVVKMSKGIIEGDKVIITSGPLKGNEGCIKKIDRHKRKAYLEVEMFGRMVETQVGVEIVEKN